MSLGKKQSFSKSRGNTLVSWKKVSQIPSNVNSDHQAGLDEGEFYQKKTHASVLIAILAMPYNWPYTGNPLTITTNLILIKQFSVHYHSALVTLFGVSTRLVSFPNTANVFTNI